ncbi:MAG: hypothetical protein IT260_19270 [Saprospiraceae bacterium]|nr:hypothetical protein [Saprospiraceae bacterium]
MKKHLLLPAFACLLLTASLAQQPTDWSSRGIGGGGALFAPSINPANHQELYIACDMSELFHSTDQGQHWQELPFQTLQGGHRARVQFTSNPAIRYCIDYASIDGIDYQRPVKSTDGGLHWTALSGDPEPGESALGLFASYQNPAHLLLSYYSTLYASTDGGASFKAIHTALDNGSGCAVGGVFWDGLFAYAGTNDGIVIFNTQTTGAGVLPDSGIPAGQHIASFAGARSGNALRFFCLTAADVYAGIEAWDYWGFAGGVYRMDDASGLWQAAHTGLDLSGQFPFYIGMAENNIQTVYLAGSDENSNPLILKSVNAGQQWNPVLLSNQNQNILTGWMGYQGDRQWSYDEVALGFQVCPNDAGTLVFTGYGMAHLSADGGGHWKQLYVAPGSQHPENQPTPKGKYYLSNGLENTSCWQVCWLDAQHLLGAYSDIRGIQSQDAGASWRFIPGISHNSTYRILPHSDGKVYAATSTVHDLYQSTYLTDTNIDNGSGAVSVSTDNGQNFSLLHDFQHPVVWIATDPTEPKRMYAAVAHSTQGGIFKTENLNAGAASTWTLCAKPPRTEGHPFNILVLNDGTLLCTYSGRRTGQGFTKSAGVFASSDQGAHWQDLSHPNMQWWTKDLIVDPHDAGQNTWYVSVFSGWANVPAGTGGLYRTTNRGQSWQQISDAYRVNSATVSPDNPNALYFTTETDGLWYTGNAQQANPVFSRVESYGFRQPMRVFFNPYQSKEIWVSSFGAGLKKGLLSGNTPVFEPVEMGLQLFPNPASGRLRLHWSAAQPAPESALCLYDAQGRLQWSVEPAAVGKNDWELDLPALPGGLYWVKWGNFSGRLVVH